ncbi:hypothetical protein FZX01_05375 [Listeria monocytogenes]|uniref:hypothetical protein n=1 Tax=Listeria monocytogenes TaxID=1639 RepID=UPI0011EA7AC1|nr:hypothetical protein [Listeria monocytogenes]TYU88942.1 hypothetical protein FZX01_05375 [Listeria monocytogenes]
MFKFLSKKEETEEFEETELTDLVNVSNLKSYVVEGYEKEKQLKNELEQKDRRIQALQKQLHEYDAIKVVLEQKEREIVSLESKIREIPVLESMNTDLKERLNEKDIANRKLNELRRANIAEARQEVTGKLVNEIVARLQEHKGNLSKAQAVEIAKGVK